MANTYKTIGNTTAAVVSLLAIGTLCWWQRTPGPITAPRPQDEAEIMTAILERHYAMGRHNVGFFTSHPEVTAGVITNAPAYTTTNTIGFFPNAPRRYATAMRTAYMGRWLQARQWWQWGGVVNLEVWHGAAWAWPLLRSDSIVWVGDGWWESVDKTTGWIIPNTNYMATGDMSWFNTETTHTNIFAPPLNYIDYYTGIHTYQDYIDTFYRSSAATWTNYITLPSATWITVTNYTTDYVTNRVVGGITNVVTNTTFSTTNYVNTGFREDPYCAPFGGDAVAMKMAWERDLYYDEIVDSSNNRRSEPAGGLLAREASVVWSTNVYHDFGRALSVLQWIRDYRQATTNVYWYARYTNGILSSISSTTGFSVASPSAGSYRYDRRGRTNSEAWATCVLYDFVNPTPFQVDNVLFQQTSHANVNCPPAWDAGPAPITSVAAGAAGSSGWWPIDPDAMRPFVDDFARTNTTAATYIVFSMDIPYDCYHVQFSAITNYLDHAPAR